MIHFKRSSETSLIDSCLSDSLISTDFERVADESYNDRSGFFEQLFKEVSEKYALEFKSVPFESYDFYHDCIFRYVGKGLIAFKMWKDDSWKEWHYDYIHRLVNYQVNRWKNQQEEGNQHVAIVMPIGINFLVGLFTAIRLGLKFTALPLDSPQLPMKRVRAILDELNLDLILTTPEASSTIPGDETHWLVEYLEESDKYDAEENYIYKPQDVFQVAYGCQVQNKPALLPVSAQDMFLCSVRDAHLIFGLEPGMSIGYCSDCSLKEQPYLMMVSLLSGTRTVHFSEKVLKPDPHHVTSEQIHVLGLNPFLRKLWTEHEGLPKSKLVRWYFSLFDNDEKSWSTFIAKNSLEKTPSRRLNFDNACPGVSIVSVKVQDEPRDYLWPTFGTEWELLQYGQQEVVSTQSYGVFKLNSAANIASNLLLTKLRVGWEVAIGVTDQKRGYTIPVDELERAICSIDFVKFAFFFMLPTPNHSLINESVLLVFVDPSLSEEVLESEVVWRGKINEEIVQTLGLIYLPDRVEIFPLIPRVVDGVVDRNWCRHQYVSGLFERKKLLKIYHWISLLKKTVLNLDL